MNSNKFLLGGIAGGIAFFLLGYVIYGMLFKTYFDNNGMAFEMDKLIWWANIVSNLLYGFLIAYVLGKANVSSAAAGASIGLVVGLLLEASVDLGFYSIGKGLSNLTAICADVALYLIMGAIIGAIVGWVYGRGKKAA